MSDVDKKAFEKWFQSFWGEEYDPCKNIDKLQEMSWQDACEYKQKEIDQLASDNKFQADVMCDMGELVMKIKKLQIENAKIRDCLEFTTHAAEYLYKPDVKLNRGMSPTFYFTLTYEGDLELMEKTKRARQVLKELEK